MPRKRPRPRRKRRTGGHRRLGFTDVLVHGGTHRVWEHIPSGSRFTLGEYPPEDSVHEEILFGVRLQLDNFGNMAREEFERWAKRRAKANERGDDAATRTSTV